MIIVQLMGGLGNQMFQYALGRRLALDRKVELKLDLSWFELQTKRKYKLHHFNISAELASRDDVDRVKYVYDNRYLRKVFGVYQKHIPYWKRTVIKEKDSSRMDRNILSVSKSCLITGYWQSENYFRKIQEIIRNDFSLKSDLPEIFSETVEKIVANPGAVSVHFRRGDYVLESTGHWVCPTTYYDNAIKYITQFIPNPTFYVFSDDINWVKKNIRFDYPTNFIVPSGNDVFDLELMRKCKSHINANSSYSWWGAWLGERKNGHVIVPKKWFVNKPYPEDRIPERWIRI